MLATGGKGGASGKAGGVPIDGELAAVVNFGSSNCHDLRSERQYDACASHDHNCLPAALSDVQTWSFGCPGTDNCGVLPSVRKGRVVEQRWHGPPIERRRECSSDCDL